MPMAIDETTLHGMLEGDATHPGKVDKISGMGLSTNDYTNAEKAKLAEIEEAANNYRLPIASKHPPLPFHSKIAWSRCTSSTRPALSTITFPLTGGRKSTAAP